MLEQGFITTPDKTQLYYEIHGEGDPTCIVPAACFLSMDWQPLTRSRRVVFYDPRNRGSSFRVDGQRAAVGLDIELSDIDNVRRHFSLETFVLIGWSYLGAMAALYASHYRQYVHKLIMIGAIPPRPYQHYADDPVYQTVKERGTARVDQKGKAAIERLRAAGVHESDPFRYCREYRKIYRPSNMYNLAGMRRMKNDPCQYENEHPDRVADNMKSLYANFGEWDWRAEAQQISCPALLIHGEEDRVPLAGAIDWATCIPQATLQRIPECAHFPWLEAPEAFFPMIEDFLNK